MKGIRRENRKATLSAIFIVYNGKLSNENSHKVRKDREEGPTGNSP